MEGSIKKRKICVADDHLLNHSDDDEEEEEEEEEEKKIAEFCSLIRSIREVRNHLVLKGSAELMVQKTGSCNNKKNSVNEEEPDKGKVGGVIPSFQREDFVDDLNFRTPPALPTSSQSQINQGSALKEEIKGGIDLNLWL